MGKLRVFYEYGEAGCMLGLWKVFLLNVRRRGRPNTHRKWLGATFSKTNQAIGCSLIWCVSVFFYTGDVFSHQNLLGLLILAGFLAHIITKKLGILIGVAYLYFALFQIIRFCYPIQIYNQFDLPTIVGLESIAAVSFIYVTLITLYFAFFNHNLKNIFVTLATCNSVVLLSKIALDKNPYFLMNNAAIDTAFIASCLPLVLNNFYLAPLFIVTCILAKTSSGILGVGVACFFYFLIKMKSLRVTVISALGALGVFIVGLKMQGAVLFNGSGRYEIWKMAWDYFWNEGVRSVGSGAGTYTIYGPTLQMRGALENDAHGFPGFFWAHNDWLQMLFETGFVGLGFASLIFIVALWRARRNAVVFSGLLTLGSVGFIQMPLRWWTFSMLLCFYIKQSQTNQLKV